MSFAKVTDNNIDKIVTRLPEAARRLDNGAWVMALRRADTATQEACGWYRVVDELRPTTDTGIAAVEADPDADPPIEAVEGVPGDPTIVVYRRAVMVDGVPTRRWFERPKDDSENAKDAAVVAEKSTRDAAVAAHGKNKDFLALNPPTTQQALRQIGKLTQQVNGLIRLVVEAGLTDEDA